MHSISPNTLVSLMYALCRRCHHCRGGGRVSSIDEYPVESINSPSLIDTLNVLCFDFLSCDTFTKELWLTVRFMLSLRLCMHGVDSTALRLGTQNFLFSMHERIFSD